MIRVRKTILPSGIYQIQSIVNGKRYIGSAVNLKRRKKEHFSCLSFKNHYNLHLQNHTNKYGIEDLQFSIIEFCPKEKLIEREQYWINELKPEFNICKTAGSSLGLICSEETKQKMRLHQVSRKGKTHSDESKKKMSESRKKYLESKFDSNRKPKIR